MGRHEAAFEVHKQLEVLEILKGTLAANSVLQEDDEVGFLSAVESETNIMECLAMMSMEDLEIDGNVKKLAGMIKVLQDRKRRMEAKKDNLRALFSLVLDRLKQKNVRTAFGTVTRSKKPDDIDVLKEADIPPDFWVVPKPKMVTPDPYVDMDVLKEAAITIHKKREERRAEIYAPYAEEIAAAAEKPTPEQQREALALVEAKVADQLAQLDEELPLIPGVQVKEPAFTITIRR